MKKQKIITTTANTDGYGVTKQTQPAAPERLNDDGFWESGILEEWSRWEPCPPDLFLDDKDIQKWTPES